MYHDLNVDIGPDSRESALRALSRLGYDVVAFTTTVTNTCKLGPEHAPKRPPGSKPVVYSVNPGDSVRNRFHSVPEQRVHGITVLERITLVIDDTSQLVLLSSPVLAAYDLVAVRPASEKLFQQCLQFDFDIISLSLEKRQLFHVKRPQVHVAAEKGIVFEINYASALRDSVSRRFIIGNACSLSRAASGKNLILSSGAKHQMELRGPHDVSNLGLVFDIQLDLSRNAIGRLAGDTVSHGDVRARVHKGIVRIEATSSAGHSQKRTPSSPMVKSAAAGVTNETMSDV